MWNRTTAHHLPWNTEAFPTNGKYKSKRQMPAALFGILVPFAFRLRSFPLFLPLSIARTLKHILLNGNDICDTLPQSYTHICMRQYLKCWFKLPFKCLPIAFV